MASAKIVQLKTQSVNALITQAKAAWDRADEEKLKVDDWLIRTGRLLVELKQRTKHGEWGEALKKIGRSQQRASELMELARGTKTVEEQRERKRESVERTRAKPPLRSGGLPKNTEGPGLDSPEVSRIIAKDVDDIFADAHPEYAEQPHEVWLNSLSSLCADVMVRMTHWDRQMPGWRKFELPSHVAKLVEEAAAALTSITVNVAKRDRKRA